MNIDVNMKGTGTWNDERSDQLVYDSSKSSTSRRTITRQHTRRPITHSEYAALSDAMSRLDLAPIAQAVRRLKTGEFVNDRSVDDQIEAVAADLEANRSTPWTVVITQDDSPRDGTRYYLELYRVIERA